MSARQPKRRRRERYAFADSPWVQNLTQRDLAELLRFKKAQLELMVSFKEAWIIRRTATVGGKVRDLAYPFGKLRWVHERLKHHLGKIKQPEYLYSPRGGRAQRDNAALHVGQNQFLTLDICQFYPSTSSEHVFRWAHHVAGLRPDVAGILTKLATVDDRLSFGSPLSPVLATLVHRKMFDDIHEACRARGLRMSLWVDDLTISGRFIPGELLSDIRAIVARAGLRSHKIRYRSGARQVTITGIPVCRSCVIAPRALHQRVQDGYALLRAATSDVERANVTDLLLGQLGSLRYHVGKDSTAGRRAADRMNALRRRHKALTIVVNTGPPTTLASSAATELAGALPWA
jgi:hypothetical protein